MNSGSGNTDKVGQRGVRGGHMEKQETEIKRKLEMETGNGNWKLKTEMETKDAPITGAIFSS